MKWLGLICDGATFATFATCFTISLSGMNTTFTQTSEVQSVDRVVETDSTPDLHTAGDVELEVALMTQIFTSVIEKIDVDTKEHPTNRQS